jgi:putative mRNA 3-end processing factor
MKISFLGGAGEVGRMGILLDNNREKFLMDYGVNVETMDVPLDPGLGINHLLLSHAHLDHSGNVPSFYRRGWNGRVYATPTTFDLCSILLRDSIKVQGIKGLTSTYNIGDVEKMEKLGVNMPFGMKREFKSGAVEFNDAGHVPGSASTLIETCGKRILYTGDIKFSGTSLMKSAFSDFEEIDVMMIESTYAYKDHPPRSEIVNRLKEIIESTVQGGGFVLLPSFAVGRAQELLMAAAELNVPICMDGMGIAASRAIIDHMETVANPKKLKDAFGMARKIKSAKQRELVLQTPGVIITTAGMLSGGPAGFYMRKLHAREDSYLVMNGFQIPGTPGRTLLDTGRYIYEDVDVKPKMRVDFLDFSAHCGREEIINFVEKVAPEKVFLVHGERSEALAQMLTAAGFDTTVPKNGDIVRVD